MIKKVIVASIFASSMIVAGASAQTIGDSMMKKEEGAMMKKEDSAMMMKKEESGAMMKKTISTTASAADISDLQTVLIEKGYLIMPAGASKGSFGKLTKAALIKYQKASGLNASGYFGPLTKAKLVESKAMMMKKETTN
jgi:peptidoglycan hydrolase-like protein with peptidoglycan-binding domain